LHDVFLFRLQFCKIKRYDEKLSFIYRESVGEWEKSAGGGGEGVIFSNHAQTIYGIS
jgi:hypothetical protein